MTDPVYGRAAVRLAQGAGVSEDQADEFLDLITEEYPDEPNAIVDTALRTLNAHALSLADLDEAVWAYLDHKAIRELDLFFDVYCEIIGNWADLGIKGRAQYRRYFDEVFGLEDA